MRKVKCPRCKKIVAWSDNSQFKPFCSARCRLLDLGASASEKHRIKGETPLQLDEEKKETTEH